MFYMLKRKLTTMKKVNTLFFFVCFTLICLISVSYSALSQNLMITGDVGYFLESKKLYDVLMKEARMNRLAREYTGAHQDSFFTTGDKDIFYYYATNAAEGDSIQNKNNVIFAGQCWQMIRTTDTGGVKMIYNGEPVNNQCLNTRGTHVGYGGVVSSSTLNSSYYYGTSYSYDSENQVFSLAGTLTQATWDATTGPTLIGKYTCKSATKDDTCETLYFTESYRDATKAVVLSLNGNSPYSEFGTLSYNASYNSLAYLGYMYNAVYSAQTITLGTTTYKYAAGFTYNNGTYTLNSDSVSFAGSSSSNIDSLATHHYTCWNTTGTCTNISYVYLYEDSVISYISFSGGKSVSDVIAEMLSDNNVNVKNSVIKTGVEAWYAKYLEPYSNYLEDAVYCSRREIWGLDAWNPNGGTIIKSVSPWLRLRGNAEFGERDILSCANITDRFTTTNSLARLPYKVGLITAQELTLLGNNYARTSPAIYFTLTPYAFMDVTSIRRMNEDGVFGTTRCTNSRGVRPAISLAYGTRYMYGDGSMSNPYVVDNYVPSEENWQYWKVGSEEIFIAPKDGLYKLEVWGAQGATSGGTGGYGGYSVGDVYLEENQVIHINVGGTGTITGGGYNGGGSGSVKYRVSAAYQDGGGGGGATHIAKTAGLLSTFSANQSNLLIVAGGGGGGAYISANYVGGSGGGYIGNSATGHSITINGGTQSTGNAFGQGQNAIAGANESWGESGRGGGGGGFYGGNASQVTVDGVAGGGGGSGYIGNFLLTNKHMTCYNCATSNDIHTKTNTNTNVSETPTSDYSKIGNGFAKITLIEENTHTVSVTSTDATKGTITPSSTLVEDGSAVSFMINPNTGYQYYDNSCNGIFSDNILTISNVNQNITCTVRFVTSKNFDYTGGEQTFTAPEDGLYKLEVWGAQGGSSSAQSINGGYGGYSTGAIVLSQGTTLYINVGGAGSNGTSGTTINGGYNGGGNGYYAANGRGSGGGASSVSTSSGTLYNLGQNNNQNDIVIVAGGYGYYSSTQYGAGGNGGGIQGNDGDNNYSGDAGAYVAAYGGTQSAGGSGVAAGLFGKGADAIQTYNSNAWGGAGGGGGYYGGGAAHNNSGGGGGSGYIGNSLLLNKHMTCYNCTTSNEIATKTISNTNVSATATADSSKTGNGYAKITFIEDVNLSATYTLTFNTHDGTACTPSSITAQDHSAWGTLCTTTKSGYVFKEWNTAADGSGTVITSNSAATGNLTVHAIWIPVYRITYNSNGGDACDPTYKDQVQGVAWGTLCTLTREGYIFNGWKDGNNNIITSASIATSNITVTAQWIEITTISWDYDYTGEVQTFTPPYPGTYKIELYGAQGMSGGNGAYVYGNVTLYTDTTYYVYVGGQEGWNGGGIPTNGNYGGDATDIRLTQGDLYSRIMVAGGGGSGGTGRTTKCNYPNWACGPSTPGVGGLASGGASTGAHQKEVWTVDDSTTSVAANAGTNPNSKGANDVLKGASGGTQTAGGAAAGASGDSNTIKAKKSGTAGSFGKGGNGVTLTATSGTNFANAKSGSGGGGYWGGGAGSCAGTYADGHEARAVCGGAGGSSFIHGVSGYTRHSSATFTSSEYVFTSAGGSAGNRSGTGYAKITYID